MVLEMTPEHKVHCRYLSVTFKKSAKIYIDFDILPVIIFWYPHKERCREKKNKHLNGIPIHTVSVTLLHSKAY